MKNKLGEEERRALLRVLAAIFNLVRGHPRLPRTRAPLNALLRLALTEADGRAMSVGELQSALGLAQSATSRLVAALRKSGVIETIPDKDARKTAIRLSKAGRTFINEVLTTMNQALAREGLIKR